MKRSAVNRSRAFRRILNSESSAIVRDPALLSVVMMAALPAAIFFFYSDEFNDLLAKNLGVGEGTRVAAGFVSALPGLLIGWVFAMRFLEERDEGLEAVIAATRFGLWQFTLLRLFLAGTLAFPLTFTTAFTLDVSASVALAAAFCGSFQAILVAAVFPVLASNRVEGLAYSKAISPFALAALASLADSNLRFLVAPLPTFHMGELLSRSASLQSSNVAAALIVNLLWALLAMQLLKRSVSGKVLGRKLSRTGGS